MSFLGFPSFDMAAAESFERVLLGIDAIALFIVWESAASVPKMDTFPHLFGTFIVILLATLMCNT